MQVGPPEGWDPDHATTRMRWIAHSRQEHADWLAEKEDDLLVNHCEYCDV